MIRLMISIIAGFGLLATASFFPSSGYAVEAVDTINCRCEDFTTLTRNQRMYLRAECDDAAATLNVRAGITRPLNPVDIANNVCEPILDLIDPDYVGEQPQCGEIGNPFTIICYGVPPSGAGGGGDCCALQQGGEERCSGRGACRVAASCEERTRYVSRNGAAQEASVGACDTRPSRFAQGRSLITAMPL